MNWRLIKLVLFSRLSERNKARVRQAWEEQRLRFPWGPVRQFAQKRAVLKVRRTHKHPARTSIIFNPRPGMFQKGKDSDGRPFVDLPLIVDAPLDRVVPPDPVAFSVKEPGVQGRLWDANSPYRDYPYRNLVANLASYFVESLKANLPRDDYLAIRLAHRDGNSLSTASALYVAAANQAMMAVLTQAPLQFNAFKRSHQNLWNDVLEASGRMLAARESQFRKTRILRFSNLNQRHRTEILEAWRCLREWEGESIDLAKASLSAYVDIRMRASGGEDRGHEFAFEECEYQYFPDDLRMILPIIVDAPLPGL